MDCACNAASVAPALHLIAPSAKAMLALLVAHTRPCSSGAAGARRTRAPRCRCPPLGRRTPTRPRAPGGPPPPPPAAAPAPWHPHPPAGSQHVHFIQPVYWIATNETAIRPAAISTLGECHCKIAQCRALQCKQLPAAQSSCMNRPIVVLHLVPGSHAQGPRGPGHHEAAAH